MNGNGCNRPAACDRGLAVGNRRATRSVSREDTDAKEHLRALRDRPPSSPWLKRFVHVARGETPAESTGRIPEGCRPLIRETTQAGHFRQNPPRGWGALRRKKTSPAQRAGARFFTAIISPWKTHFGAPVGFFFFGTVSGGDGIAALAGAPDVDTLALSLRSCGWHDAACFNASMSDGRPLRLCEADCSQQRGQESQTRFGWDPISPQEGRAGGNARFMSWDMKLGGRGLEEVIECDF